MEPTARTLIAALARRHGRDLAAVAYLVLDNREAASRSAAAGMATVLRRAGGPATVIDHDRLRVAMVGATLARALEAHRTTREVDPVLDSADRAALGRLTALQRAVAAGHLLASLQLDDLATELEMPVAKVAATLSTAEAVAGGASELTAQMANHQAGITLAVSVDLVEWELGVTSCTSSRSTVAGARPCACRSAGGCGHGRLGRRRATWRGPPCTSCQLA